MIQRSAHSASIMPNLLEQFVCKITLALCFDVMTFSKILINFSMTRFALLPLA